MAAQPGQPLDAGDALALTERLVERIRAAGGLRDPAWHAAFARVPRAAFVPFFYAPAPGGGHERLWRDDRDPRRRARWAEGVASDRPLATRLRDGELLSSSSRPSLMARMLESLRIGDAGGGARHHGGAGHHVLEIGTGTGYNAALLCARYGAEKIATLDIDPELTTAARERLHTAGYTPTIVTGDGTRGHTPRAPHSAIIATCGLPRIPAVWLSQLAPGGTVVANLGYGLASLNHHDDGSLRGRFLPEMAAFMTARHSPEDSAPNACPEDIAGLMPARGRTTTVQVAGDVTAPMPRFLSGMLHHDTIDVSLVGDDGRTVHLIQHPASGAWARMAPHGAHGARLDHDGPEHRNLWGERLVLIKAWFRAGHPGPDRYGLTVAPNGTHTLWLDSPDGPSWVLPA